MKVARTVRGGAVRKGLAEILPVGVILFRQVKAKELASSIASLSPYLASRLLYGRPTNEELRHDLRTMMESRSDYRYEAYDTPEVRQIRIPQQEWVAGPPPPGASGLPVAHGVVRWFDLHAGVGTIARDGTGDEVFFHFTALPGQGYRTIWAGTAVKFELVESSRGLTARNIQSNSMP